MTEEYLCGISLGVLFVFGSIAFLATLFLLFLFVSLILLIGFDIDLIDLSLEHGGLFNFIKKKFKGE